MRATLADVVPGDAQILDEVAEVEDGGRSGARQTRSDSCMITLTDGSQIEYQASLSFPRHIYLKMKQDDRDI